MKKIILLSALIVSFTLTGCTNNQSNKSVNTETEQTNLSKKDLTNIYNSINDAETNVWNKLSQSITDNKNEMSATVSDSDKVYQKNISILNHHKNEKNVSDMLTLVKDYKNNTDKYLSKMNLDSSAMKSINSEGNASKELRKKLNISTPKKLNASMQSVDTAIKNFPKNKKSILITENQKPESKVKHYTLSDGTSVAVTSGTGYTKPFSDNSWRGGKLDVKWINVLKTKPFKYQDGNNTQTINGIIMIKFTYQASQDVTLYDGQAKLTTNGQQIDVDSSEGDDISDINSSVTKTGTSVFLLPKLDSSTSVKNIRWQFDAAPQNKSSDDLHTFDFSFDLK